MHNILKSSILVDKAGMAMKLASFFVLHFCSLFLLLVGLDRSQNTKGIEMNTNNKPVAKCGLNDKQNKSMVMICST